MPQFEKIEYKPIPVHDLLLEMKNLSELMIDLAYSAALFNDKELAEDVIELEGRIRADVAEALRGKGNPVHHWPDGFVPRMGLAHGIKVAPDSHRWEGGADPRGQGGIAWSHV